MNSELTIYDPGSPLDLSAMFTPVSLDLPDNLSFGDWCRIMRQLALMDRSVHWWIGDALVYAGKHYGETYTEAEALTGFATKTLKLDKWVASSVKKSIRMDNLSWNHHQLIAPMDQDQQAYWLKLAEQSNWTISELRKQIKHQYLIDNTPNLPDGNF